MKQWAAGSPQLGRNGGKKAVNSGSIITMSGDVAHQIMYDLAPAGLLAVPYGKLHGKQASLWQRSTMLILTLVLIL